MNTKPERVVVTMAAIDDVCACHGKAVKQTVKQLLPSLEQRGYKYYTVDRMELFWFANAHGEVCRG